jgi:hypothetical protein
MAPNDMVSDICKALYSGVGPAMMGIFPEAALTYGMYDLLKDAYVRWGLTLQKSIEPQRTRMVSSNPTPSTRTGLALWCAFVSLFYNVAQGTHMESITQPLRHFKWTDPGLSTSSFMLQLASLTRRAVCICPYRTVEGGGR